ncbi:DUF3530 family protein [Marinomonas sp. 15G1-11]|uniref:DUF3530 family protein n=1 Tax=Marinomonas phaeophyticola TaxID=3004091 RepID=A0ABT4JSK3_9GAMM|nr:DUF3530 family protein [Marinomonas sp. 15G1-11]MCZ2721166.1 DUF3530 family protein [Marinomonas sp. 15G1-11]
MIAIKKSGFLLLITLVINAFTPAKALAAEEDETKTAIPASSGSNAVREAIPLASPQERRIKALIDSISINRAHEIETIESPNDAFLALFKESATGDPQGCVLLIHGDNEHPDWPQAISPIRNTLTDNSWCTLSIEIPDTTKRFQLPLFSDSTANETAETSQGESEAKMLPNEEVIFNRIEQARQHLRDKGYSRLVFLGHGTGATYALKYTIDKNISESALVLIDPITPLPFSDYEIAELIESIGLPVLDYYFNNHLNGNRFAQYRLSASKKRLSKSDAYIQVQAPADRRYGSAGDKRLTQRVWGFLKQNTHQIKQTRPLPEIEKGLFSEDPFE